MTNKKEQQICERALHIPARHANIIITVRVLALERMCDAMRIVLKILAAPVMCLLALIVAIFLFILSVTGFILWILSVLVAIGGVVLLFTQHTAGGIAFLVIAFLVSPYGLPALAAWLVGKLEGLRYSLKEFILG